MEPSRNGQLDASARQTPLSLFNDLPPEVVFLIAEHCPLYETVALAHTCRSLHHYLRPIYIPKWAAASTRERVDFLWEFWWKAPVLDHYLCAPCNKFHRVVPSDLPYPSHPFERGDGCKSSSIARNEYARFYPLAQHHVAIALQYNKLTGPEHKHRKAYLNALLKPYTVTRPLSNEEAVYFTAWPFIIENQFILHTRWRFPAQPAWVPPVSSATARVSPPFRFCPHQLYHPPTHYDYPKEKINVISDAIERLLNYRRFLASHPGTYASCPMCATDFWIKANSRELEVWVYQNLGEEGHPREHAWRMQMGNGPGFVPLFARHRAGAVREMVVRANKKGKEIQDGSCTK